MGCLNYFTRILEFHQIFNIFIFISNCNIFFYCTLSSFLNETLNSVEKPACYKQKTCTNFFDVKPPIYLNEYYTCDFHTYAN